MQLKELKNAISQRIQEEQSLISELQVLIQDKKSKIKILQQKYEAIETACEIIKDYEEEIK